MFPLTIHMLQKRNRVRLLGTGEGELSSNLTHLKEVLVSGSVCFDRFSFLPCEFPYSLQAGTDTLERYSYHHINSYPIHCKLC
jgi:hypothetical protein